VARVGKVSSVELNEWRQRCGLTPRKTAERLGVTLRTWQRWQHDGAPGWVLALLRIWAGEPPWSGWEGWRFTEGKAWPPGYRNSVTPGQVLAVPYRLQQVAGLQRQVREFWAMDDQVEAQPEAEEKP